MASLQQTELSYAWEKYMDCRLQGADLQVRTQAQLRGVRVVLMLDFAASLTLLFVYSMTHQGQAGTLDSYTTCDS